MTQAGFIDAAEAPPRATNEIKLYGPEGFAGMRKAGRLAAECLDMLIPHVVPGVTTQKIDDMAREFGLREQHLGEPFQTVSRVDQREEIATDHYFGGVRIPDHAGLHPGLYHQGLLDAARAAGVTICAFTPVYGFRKKAEGFTVFAKGAKVEARIGEDVLTRWVGAWSSFDSQGPLAVTFGLGERTVVDELTVTFTNGVVQTMTQVAADQALVVAEEVSRSDADHDGVPDEWDLCPETRLGQLHDADGCAPGQRAGLPLGLVSPEQDAVLTVPPTFRWEGEFVSAVVQVSLDGTFGAASRFDFGPYALGGALLTDADWAALLEESDGSRALLWRVVALGEDGETAVTAPRRFYAAQPTEVVSIPFGASLFLPAHIVVPVGTTVTWWNDPVSAGNLQGEPHDVQLIDSTGLILSPMAALNAAGVFTWTFDTVGQYHYLCQRHSGPGWSGDTPMENSGILRADGPFRCMAGTVTVR
jgi:plastocyanin